MKSSRIILLGILLGGSAQASAWPDLWFRRDQQAEHALQAGDSKRAAELFTDPRRQAYAQLQAEQYAAAAKRLEPFADAASQYNRGNALAKNGDLQGALSAYDGALKHADLESTLRRDAQHNRDLVARHLQEHPSSGGQSQSKDKQDGKPQGNDTKGASGGATAGTSSPSQGDKNKPEKGEPGASTPTSPSQPSSSSPAQSRVADAQRQEDQKPQSTKDRDASVPQPSGQPAAQRQAPESASRSGNQQLNSREPAIGDSSLPQSEQQLALEQWLRQIPDDPGGLLRRKFMIEHLMKQQQVQP